MADAPRFLIGYGERLTAPVVHVSGGSSPPPPYELAYARTRLAPSALETSVSANGLPSNACPRDRVVSVVTLHPRYIAKSYFPGALLRAAGFEPIGSRPTQLIPEIMPRSVTTDGVKSYVFEAGTELRATTELFVESTRDDVESWANLLSGDEDLDDAFADIAHIEAYRLPSPDERVRMADESGDEVTLEVVLHGAGDPAYAFVLDAFEAYADDLDAQPDMDRRLQYGRLCFLPTRVAASRVTDLAQFSFMRVARSMPRLRAIGDDDVFVRSAAPATMTIPDTEAIDPSLRVAVFDGGLGPGTQLAPWVTARDAAGVGPAVPGYVGHGHKVTSALLFGPINTTKPLPTPYANVDNYRVLDGHTGTTNPFDHLELYDVIQRIENVLAQNNYEFINLSVGPAISVEDDEIHAWTAFLDAHLADGRVLASVAIGNNGEMDRATGNARLQVPGDAVNALAVGASDSRSAAWVRAPYSAFGPGRSPGIMKPDVVGFGGVQAEPFLALDVDHQVASTGGTSFASPATLRTALGIRCFFRDRLEALALKALLIHTSEPCTAHDPHEHGWGRVQSELEPIVLCGDGVARVVYQGELTPAKYLRVQLPLPTAQLQGMVKITATLAFATGVEPESPSTYTRSGVEVWFRPDATKFSGPTAHDAKTSPFFGKSGYETEAELRNDAHKWETVLHQSVTKRGSSLNQPVFDIHYNARSAGHDGTSTAAKIRYAMVITVESKRTPDLYDQVLRTFATQLEALTPRLRVPIRT